MKLFGTNIENYGTIDLATGALTNNGLVQNNGTVTIMGGDIFNDTGAWAGPSAVN